MYIHFTDQIVLLFPINLRYNVVVFYHVYNNHNWLTSLLLAAAASARVAPETRRSTCSTDKCSQALLQKPDAALLLCNTIAKTVKRHVSRRSPPEACVPAALVPYPEFAGSCFEDGQDLSQVERTCECLIQGSLRAESSNSAGAVQSVPGGHGSGAAVGGIGASSDGSATFAGIATTEI